MDVINTIGPLVLIVALGAALRRSGFLTLDFFERSNKLTFWVGLPALLFLKLAESDLNPGRAMPLLLGLFATTLACAALAYVIAAILRLPRPSRGAFVQGSFRGNLAYVGLPTVLYDLAGRESAYAGDTEALAVLSLGGLAAFFNVISVVVLVNGQPVSGRKDDVWRRTIIGTVTNPLVLACGVGLTVGMLLEGPLPPVLARPLGALGAMAIVLAMMGVGASLSFTHLRGCALAAGVGSLLKAIGMPLIAFGVGHLMGLSAEAMHVMMIYAACPTAVMAYVMAEQMQNDAQLSAALVALSVVLAFPVLALLLLIIP